MRIMGMFSLILASLTLSVESRTAVIEGTVIDSVTRNGIGGVNLLLTGTGDNEVVNFTTRTGPEGKFSFQRLPASAGYWLISSHGDQHVRTVYPRGLRNGKPLPVSDGQQIRNIVVEMIPTGEISGRIVDTTGRTVGNIEASLRAFQDDYYRGVASFVRAHDFARLAGSATFRRGEYRISGLPPGPLYIGVRIRNIGNQSDFSTFLRSGDFRPSIRPPLMESEGYPEEIYFPGTNDERHAQVVYLKAGERKTGIDIVVSKVRTRRIRGSVVDAGSGVPTGAHLMLIYTNAQPGNPLYRTFDTKDGRFDLRGVLPGAYYLVASTNGQPRLGGRLALEVGETDRSNLTVPVLAGFDLTGKVNAEGTLTNAALSAVAVALKAAPPALTFVTESDELTARGFLDPFRSLAVPSVRVSASRGEITFHRILPWDYTVEISHPFDDSYVKSIRMGGRDVQGSVLSLDDPPPGPLEIVLRAPAGTLEGLVLDPAQQPTETRVVLIPDQRERRDLYRNIWTNDQGRFQMRNLPPGSYKLFAWEFVENEVWLNPDFLRLYEAHGIPVRMEEGSHSIVNLQTIPPWF